jgi:CRP/FNR family transcriptional regulator
MKVNNALQFRQDSSVGKWFERDASDQLVKLDHGKLEAQARPLFFPKGGTFFLEGQPAAGIFLLCTGRAKESIISSSGRTAIVRVVGPGVILGLAAVLTGTPHESTVEMLEPSHADFLAKIPFLQLLKTSGRLGHIVTMQLIRDRKEAYASIRCRSLSRTVSERFARLVLHWAECPLASQSKYTAKAQIRVTLTHEEIAQAMGTTRETTSRTLREFREKQWITINGSIWTISNEGAIRHLAAL